MKGSYRDIITDRNQMQVYDSGWQKNQIVSECHKLIAHLMHWTAKDDMPTGIRFLKVGAGMEDDWNPEDRPAGTVDLLTPYNKEYENIVIAPSGSIVTITVTLEPGEPAPLKGKTSYPLREFGLFGRHSGQKANDYFMINYVKHHVVEKEVSASLRRQIVLEF